MSRVLKHRVLVVDDDESVREVLALLLRKEGYEVATAENGFDTLLKLKGVVIPDVIISDPNMLEMSGFEFPSGVRRRFPKISVIASSGAYGSRSVPTGVLADAPDAKLNILLSITYKTTVQTPPLPTIVRCEGAHISQTSPHSKRVNHHFRLVRSKVVLGFLVALRNKTLATRAQANCA